MDVLSLIRDFAAERIGTEPARVVPDARLEEIGIDSMMLLELMFDFEDRAGIKLPKDLPMPATVGELIGQLDRLLAGR
jgi:acyl carrier protein